MFVHMWKVRRPALQESSEGRHTCPAPHDISGEVRETFCQAVSLLTTSQHNPPHEAVYLLHGLRCNNIHRMNPLGIESERFTVATDEAWQPPGALGS